jgi:hypothetical protein
MKEIIETNYKNKGKSVFEEKFSILVSFKTVGFNTYNLMCIDPATKLVKY